MEFRQSLRTSFARADLIILDDVVMNANAHEWEKQIEWLQKEVITRLGRHGKLLIVGTRVAPIDLYKMIRDGDQWTGGKSPFTYMAMPSVLEFDENPKNRGLPKLGLTIVVEH